MYFYITSKVNNRHKVGITSDLTKRILNYCTLVPDISYLIACEPINAEVIEKPFFDPKKKLHQKLYKLS